MSNTKLNENDLFEKLSNNNELDQEILQSIFENYDKIKNLIQSIDSKEEFFQYIQYVKQKEENTEENELIEEFKDICEYSEADWMSPMISKLESVSLDKRESGCERNTNIEVTIYFNEFSIGLSYHYDHDYHVDFECVSVNGYESFKKYREGIREIMNFFGLPEEKIVDFNYIMLEWIFQNHGFCNKLSGTYVAEKYYKAFD
jgi:hypothetical protein